MGMKQTGNMEEKEAIKYIDDVLSSDYHYDETLGYQLTSDDFEWLEMAKKALEKQIPKTPIIWENKYYYSPTPNDDWGYECPCCGNQEIDYPEHHCTCGQALDWSDVI